jgi:hypothetical protein
MNVTICDDMGANGFSWVTDEKTERTSHALAADGRVWIIDPVDDAAMMAQAEELGTPVAVVQLLNQHNRDCAAVARRLGIPHGKMPRSIPDSPFEVIDLHRWRLVQEIALWWPEKRALIVAEALGTSRSYTVGRGPLGVHVFDRPWPPRKTLGQFAPEHLLVGHGKGLHGPATPEALRFALADSRRGIFQLIASLPSHRESKPK